MVFKAPSLAERLAAIGSIEGLSETLQRVFDPSIDFEEIPIPKPHDWLGAHPEPGQTFQDFIRSNMTGVNCQQLRIYLQPVGDFIEGQSPTVVKLKQYAAAFFNMEIELISQPNSRDQNFFSRINRFTLKPQILTTSVLNFLKKRIPNDGFCILAITMEDLYPKPSWNFCFGQASLINRVGVFSFARYDPAFYGEQRGADYQKILLWRSCKVLAHEITHMFGLDHCIFFKCALNGSNHLAESDSRPMHLCPVCLRKLHHRIEFDILERYRQLFRFYQENGFEKEAEWVNSRLKNILKIPF